MADVEITAATLIVRVLGADRIWALKSRLEVPLAYIVSAERDEAEARRWWHGNRAPGANLPGVITAGTFYQHGERVFWNVHDPEKAIAIRLRDDRYSRLVITRSTIPTPPSRPSTPPLVEVQLKSAAIVAAAPHEHVPVTRAATAGPQRSVVNKIA